MYKKITYIEHKLRLIAQTQAPYTNTIGLGRSILALGTLLTLLVNPIDNIFIKSITGKFITPILDTDLKYNFFYLLGAEKILLMKWLAIVILAIVISGFFQKITSILHWWIAFSFLHSSTVIDGGDQIAAIISLLIIPICILDNRKNHWHKKIVERKLSNIISIVFINIIRLQVAIIYFHAAVGKFGHEEWEDGTAIYYWLNHSFFGSNDFFNFINIFLKNSFIVSGLTYGVLVLELMIFLALFASIRYRLLILPVAIFFHIFIILFLGIFSFFFSICAALILYLYPTYSDIEPQKIYILLYKK